MQADPSEQQAEGHRELQTDTHYSHAVNHLLLRAHSMGLMDFTQLE